jgi:hypothetical protein
MADAGVLTVSTISELCRDFGVLPTASEASETTQVEAKISALTRLPRELLADLKQFRLPVCARLGICHAKVFQSIQ